MPNLGETEEDLQLAQQLVRQLRQERAACWPRSSRSKPLKSRQIRVPSAAEVRRVDRPPAGRSWRRLHNGPCDQDAGQVREIFRLITGGRIELFQQGERRQHGGWLQGRFRCDVLGYLVQELTGAGPTQPCGRQEVVVDFLPPVAENPELERAWNLYETAISTRRSPMQLGCSPEQGHQAAPGSGSTAMAWSWEMAARAVADSRVTREVRRSISGSPMR